MLYSSGFEDFYIYILVPILLLLKIDWENADRSIIIESSFIRPMSAAFRIPVQYWYFFSSPVALWTSLANICETFYAIFWEVALLIKFVCHQGPYDATFACNPF